MKTFYAQEPHVDGTILYNPGDKREADENEVKHLVELGVLGDKPPKKIKSAGPSTNPANQGTGGSGNGAIDYERDALRDLPLDKADKDQLLVIAAYEQADAAADASKADLIKAIETKRSAA